MSIPYAPDKSWNPITGCSAISAGCKNCWAAETIQRHRDLPGYDHDDPFKVTFHPERLKQVTPRQRPMVIAANLMGDWCHSKVSDEWRDAIHEVMRACKQHTFITCTKRPIAMVRAVTRARVLPNAWHGISVENQMWADDRVTHAASIANAWISCEPMLGPIGWRWLTGVRGVIVGAESGKNARPFDPAWAEATKEACDRAGVKFYMKQMAPSMGGANWDKWPASLSHLKVRELPWKL